MAVVQALASIMADKSDYHLQVAAAKEIARIFTSPLKCLQRFKTNIWPTGQKEEIQSLVKIIF